MVYDLLYKCQQELLLITLQPDKQNEYFITL
jgi:hypothetical protein